MAPLSQRARRVALAALLGAALACRAAPARADDRPTSGDMSILGGRTLGNGETVLAAGLGWPAIWAAVWFAPSSTFNLGLEGSVLYASPVMGIGGSGVGGALALPARLHLFGKDTLDVALYVRPSAFVGEGALAGQTSSFGNDLGFGALLTGGALASAQISEAVTLSLGLAGELGYVAVPDAGQSDLVATGIALLSVEALMSRDTMLFAEVRGGAGLAPERLFEGPAVLRASLGLAYLL